MNKKAEFDDIFKRVLWIAVFIIAAYSLYLLIKRVVNIG